MSGNGSGYIKLYRKAIDSGILRRRGGLKLFGLFCVMLLEARWKPGEVDGEALQAGQLLITMRRYATDHGLSVKELRNAVKTQTKRGTIGAQQRAHRHTVITIMNWALYNGEPEKEGTAKDTGKGTAGAHQGHTETPKGPSTGSPRAPKKERSKDKDIVGQARLIILDLNAVTGKQFRPESEGTIRLIMARLAKGYTLEDFKRVHRIKAAQWKDDSKMAQYLRPETLYTPKHFESYLNSAPPASADPAGEEVAASILEDLKTLKRAIREADGLPEIRRGAYLDSALRRLGDYPSGRPPQVEAEIARLCEALCLKVPQ